MSTSTAIKLYKGCIVEFIHNDKIMLGCIIEEKGTTYTLYTASKREIKLSASKIFPWVYVFPTPLQSRNEMDTVLEQCKVARTALMDTIDAVSLWECVAGEIERTSVTELAEFIEQNPTPDFIASLGRVLLEHKEYFRFTTPYFEIYTKEAHEERVRANKILVERQEYKQHAVLLMKLLWEKAQQGSVVQEEEMKDIASEIREQITVMLQRRMQYPEDTSTQMLWKESLGTIPDSTMLPVVLATSFGIIPKHYNIHAMRTGYILEGWEEPYKESITAVMASCSGTELPICSIPFISIDSASTQDIDDAIYIEECNGNTIVHFAIALPVHGMDLSSALHTEIKKRASSIYLPENTYHMLPETLGTEFFSLKANTTKPILHSKVTLDVFGEIHDISVSIEQGVIAENCTYEQCERILNEEEESIHTWLMKAYAIAEMLQKKRLNDGGVLIVREDVNISLEGEECSVVIEPAKPCIKSQLLVSELMILLNKAVAEFGQKNTIPLLHRIQDCATPTGTKRIWEAPEEIHYLVKMLTSATLDTEPKRHAALGISGYSPISSPLRRYVDFINEIQLYYWCTTGKALYTDIALLSLLPTIQHETEQTASIQKYRVRYWKLQYLAQNIATPFEGIIVEENTTLVFIYLPIVQITIRAKRSLLHEKSYIGDTIHVRLRSVLPIQNEIQVLELL